MYTTKDYRTKKELLLDLKAGKKPTYYQPNDMGFSPLPMNGRITLEGPHYPRPHKWYAVADVKDGVIVKVK